MKYFKIPFEKWKFVCALDMSDRGQLFTAIGEYTFNGKEPSDISPACLIAWMMFKEYIDYCKTQAEHGKKKGNVPEKPSRNPEDDQEQPASNPQGSLDGASSNPQITLKAPSRLPQGSGKGSDENEEKNANTLEAPSNSNNSYIHNTDIQSFNNTKDIYEGGMGETKIAGTAMDELFAFEEQNATNENVEAQEKNEKKQEATPRWKTISTVSDVDEIKKRTRTVFKKPTVDEIGAYCAERKNGISPDNFFDYYEAQGWKLSNGQKMVDWKAAVRNWEARNKKNGGTGNGWVGHSGDHSENSEEARNKYRSLPQLRV